jgi:hypothetical protein
MKYFLIQTSLHLIIKEGVLRILSLFQWKIWIKLLQVKINRNLKKMNIEI